ncbi:MAG TPA: STAS domain-containing protein, partial [bacterium]
MRIKKQRRDNVLILTLLESRLDANNAPHFKSEIQHLVNSDIRGLVINIANLEFIDSTGLGAIVKGLKLMDRRAA